MDGGLNSALMRLFFSNYTAYFEQAIPCIYFELLYIKGHY